MSLGDFLNDYFRALVPHTISPDDYVALQNKLFSAQPQDQINVTGPVTGPNDIAQRQASGAYDQGPTAPMIRGPSAGLQQSILRLLPPQIGASYAMKLAQEAPEQNARSDIADALSKSQNQPTLPGMTRMDALARAGNGDIAAGAANLGTNPAGSLPPATPPQINPDMTRQLALKMFLAGGNPADVGALMNIGRPTPLIGHPGDTFINPNDYSTIKSVPQLPSYGEESTAPNPATGKVERYVVDSKSGQVKWLGVAPPAIKTLQPSDLGLSPGMLSPGTIIQQGADGEITIKKASDVKSTGAIQQERDTAAANNPVLSVIGKIQRGEPLTEADNRVLQVEKPNAAVNDDAVKQTAQSIAKYQLAPLSGFAMRSPFGQAVMAQVTELNPDYQAQNFTKSQAGYKAFASGRQGDQMRFADNAIGHMNTALQLADALGNGNVPLFNSVRQTFAQQTGSPAPTNFDTAKQIISGEVVKAITGAGGALADRQEAQAAFSRASSPAQLKGAIQTAQTLLARQLQGLGRQYKNSTMRDDFPTLLSPESQALMGSGTAPTTGNRAIHFNDLPK